MTDGVVRKRNDTLQWSREGQKHGLVDNWIIMYSVIMLLCVCMYILFCELMLAFCMLKKYFFCIVMTRFFTSIWLHSMYMFAACAN